MGDDEARAIALKAKGLCPRAFIGDERVDQALGAL